MPKKEGKKEAKVAKEAEGFYKGYDIRWLEKETSHPDHYLVEEYKALKESENK